MTATPTAGPGIADFLKAQATMMRQIATIRIGEYHGVSDFLTKHGRQFEAKPLPPEFKAGPARHCFRTCLELALRYSRLTYCEGFAAGVIPVIHAWLLDSDGQAMDPTWTGRGERPARGLDYFGVTINTRYVIECTLAKQRHGPILDDWEHNYPILTAPLEAWKA